VTSEARTYSNFDLSVGCREIHAFEEEVQSSFIGEMDKKDNESA
jgi:hypothetical protein